MARYRYRYRYSGSLFGSFGGDGGEDGDNDAAAPSYLQVMSIYIHTCLPIHIDR